MLVRHSPADFRSFTPGFSEPAGHDAGPKHRDGGFPMKYVLTWKKKRHGTTAEYEAGQKRVLEMMQA